jgi:hypothetical protein
LSEVLFSIYLASSNVQWAQNIGKFCKKVNNCKYISLPKRKGKEKQIHALWGLDFKIHHRYMHLS